MGVIGVKTGLSKIVGLSSYFKDVFGSGLIILRGTTAGNEYHREENDETKQCRE